MNSKTKKMVGVGMFAAVVVVLQLLGGGIKFGMFSISLVLIPIVVVAAVYGWQAGAILGGVFGAAVLLSGDAASFMTIDPAGTIVVVLLKGIACGFFSGLVYKFLSRKNRVIAVFTSAVVCPVVNTGVFLLGCYVFFMDTISEWAVGLGFDNAVTYMFIGLAGVNFLVELGVNLLLAPMIVRLIKLKLK